MQKVQEVPKRIFYQWLYTNFVPTLAQFSVNSRVSATTKYNAGLRLSLHRECMLQ